MITVRPEIPQMPHKISAQFVCPSPKVSNFRKKALSGCPLSVFLAFSVLNHVFGYVTHDKKQSCVFSGSKSCKKKKLQQKILGCRMEHFIYEMFHSID